MINDILDYSKMNNNALSLRPSVFYLNEIIEVTFYFKLFIGNY